MQDIYVYSWTLLRIQVLISLSRFLQSVSHKKDFRRFIHQKRQSRITLNRMKGIYVNPSFVQLSRLGVTVPREIAMKQSKSTCIIYSWGCSMGNSARASWKRLPNMNFCGNAYVLRVLTYIIELMCNCTVNWVTSGSHRKITV